VHWDESGWPEFALYAPAFQAVLDMRAQVVAAHPSRTHVRESMRGLDAEEARALALDTPLGERELAELVEEIRASHCGHAPEAMVDAMVRAQSYKDAWMARVLAERAGEVALIAGRAHILETRGVPLFLMRRGKPSPLTVALIEVEQGRDRPEEYPLEGYDLTVFTPRMSDADACAQFREQLERMRKSPEQ
jgi:uncharacterized iron-regulated protein